MIVIFFNKKPLKKKDNCPDKRLTMNRISCAIIYKRKRTNNEFF